MNEMDFVQMVAAGGEYESEYDGRTYRNCIYCHEDLDSSEHEDDCLMMLARTFLGYKWNGLESK